MKPLVHCIFFLIVMIFSCTHHPQNETIPFALQPEGLKKKIEAEIITQSKEEVKKSMRSFHRLITKHPLPTACFPQNNQLIIHRNNAGQVQIRHEIISSKRELSDRIYLYYTANIDLNEAETYAKINDHNYKYYNYPFYMHVTLPNAEQKILENAKELQRAVDEQDLELMEFYTEVLKEWRQKKEIMNTLKSEMFVEIEHSAYIQIKDAVNKKGLSSLTEDAIRGLLNLRDYAAQKYFDTSYYDLYFAATRYNNEEAQKKVDAINNLYAMRIVDESYATSEGLYTQHNNSFREVAPPPSYSQY